MDKPQKNTNDNIPAHGKERFYLRVHANGQDGFTMKDVRANAAAEGIGVNAFIIKAIKQYLRKS